MTPIQFVKKFVSKDKRLEAQEELDSMNEDFRTEGFEEAIAEAARYLRGVANEIKGW